MKEAFEVYFNVLSQNSTSNVRTASRSVQYTVTIFG